MPVEAEAETEPRQAETVPVETVEPVETSDASEGSDLEKAEAVGKRLGALGQAEAGLLLGAFVAQAVGGIDAAERKVLRAVGKAAAISDAKIRRILKAVGAEGADEA